MGYHLLHSRQRPRTRSSFRRSPGEADGRQRTDGSKAGFSPSEEFIAFAVVLCRSKLLPPGADTADSGPIQAAGTAKCPSASNCAQRAARTPNQAHQRRRQPGKRAGRPLPPVRPHPDRLAVSGRDLVEAWLDRVRARPRKGWPAAVAQLHAAPSGPWPPSPPPRTALTPDDSSLRGGQAQRIHGWWRRSPSSFPSGADNGPDESLLGGDQTSQFEDPGWVADLAAADAEDAEPLVTQRAAEYRNDGGGERVRGRGALAC